MYFNELQNRVESTVSRIQLYQQPSPKTSENIFRQQLHWNYPSAQPQQLQKHGKKTPRQTRNPKHIKSHDCWQQCSWPRSLPQRSAMPGADEGVLYATYCVATFCPTPFAFLPFTHYPLSTTQASPWVQNALNPTQPRHVSHPHPHCSLASTCTEAETQTCQSAAGTAQPMGMSQSEVLHMKIHKTHSCTHSSRLHRSYLPIAFDARCLHYQQPWWQAATAG